MTVPWAEYQTAVRRLNTIRGEAATAAATQASAWEAAHKKLAMVRGRLALNHARLRDAASQARIPEPILAPGPGEIAEAGRWPITDAASADAALSRAAATVDNADAALTGSTPQSSGTDLAALPPRVRNLLVYGPLAVIVFIIQLFLFIAIGDTKLLLAAPLCGLVIPAMAVGAGYVAVGRIFPPPPGAQVDRTPILGVLVCLVPVVLICAGLGAFAIF